MGYNTGNPYDKTEAYAKKSTRELEEIVKRFEAVLENCTNQLGTVFINEHLGWVKMLIAERIGK